MRPDDPRYAAQPLETGGAPAPDARLHCLLLCWPVIDPLSRQKMFREMKAKGPPYSRSLETLMPAQERYWQTDEAMADGTPYNIMERGEQIETPPVVFYQAEGDWAHPGSDIDRFTTLYREKGGSVEFEHFRTDGESYGNTRGATPGLPYRATQDRLSGAERVRVLAHMVDFVHSHLGGR
jgi:acetyl esterase